MAAGFLLAPTLATGRLAVPEHRLHDHRRLGQGPRLRKGEERQEHRGPHLRLERGRLPRRLPRCRDGEEAGRQAGHRRRRRPQHPVGQRLHRRLQVLRASCTTRASRCSPATRTTSSPQDKCKTVAQNQIGQGSQVEFQVAGGCGLGVLNAAAGPASGASASTSTSTTSRSTCSRARSSGSTTASTARSSRRKAGKFKGGTDVLFNLKNNGVGVGKISPKVPVEVHRGR